MENLIEKVETLTEAYFVNPPVAKIRYLSYLIHAVETEYKRRQVTNKVRFPPLPTENELLKMLSDLANKISDTIIRLKSTPLYLKMIESHYIDISLALYFEGVKRPLNYCLGSRHFSVSPAARAIVADFLSGKIRVKKGDQEIKDNYEYTFARHWLVIVKGETPSNAISRVVEIFHTSQSTVYRQMRLLEGSNEERKILDIIDSAIAFPERQDEYLNLYCQKLGESLKDE